MAEGRQVTLNRGGGRGISWIWSFLNGFSFFIFLSISFLRGLRVVGMVVCRTLLLCCFVKTMGLKNM